MKTKKVQVTRTKDWISVKWIYPNWLGEPQDFSTKWKPDSTPGKVKSSVLRNCAPEKIVWNATLYNDVGSFSRKNNTVRRHIKWAHSIRTKLTKKEESAVIASLQRAFPRSEVRICNASKNWRGEIYISMTEKACPC